MNNPFASELKRKIREQMNAYADDVAVGQCKDHAEYKYLCGTIQGLALAERFLIDLAEREEKDE